MYAGPGTTASRSFPHGGQMHNLHVVMSSFASPMAEYFPADGDRSRQPRCSGTSSTGRAVADKGQVTAWTDKKAPAWGLTPEHRYKPIFYDHRIKKHGKQYTRSFFQAEEPDRASSSAVTAAYGLGYGSCASRSGRQYLHCRTPTKKRTGRAETPGSRQALGQPGHSASFCDVWSSNQAWKARGSPLRLAAVWRDRYPDQIRRGSISRGTE